MSPFTITVSCILVAGIIAVIVNFRLLLYPFIPSMNAATHPARISLSENTLFISDLHLKSNNPFQYATKLHDFIEANHVSNLVIDGDLFDSHRDAEEILGVSRSKNNALKMLGLDDLNVNAYWVTGSPPHDPENPSASQIETESLEVLGKCALVSCGHFEVMAYHGHDMSLKGALGHAWDRFVSHLSLERSWKRLAKVDKNIWVVFGHTHIPGIDSRSRVANCGGWQSKPFVRPSGTGILVSVQEDSPRLVQIT